jgi:hypothetical protein
MDVYIATQKRLEKNFNDFDNIYVSFSGGKDSGVVLNLCIDFIRKYHLNRKWGVFHLDYEAQYETTTKYVNETLSKKTAKDFPFFNEKMWNYEFQKRFGLWIHEKKKTKRTCCLVGIRTQESLYRWHAIHSDRNYRNDEGLKWKKQIYNNVFNAYPIYDWIRVMLKHQDIYEREGGKLPVVVIEKDLSNRMASTIRHNRARSSHSIELMSNIVSELVQAGMSDAWILRNIGMDADKLLRLKQITGLASLFKDKEFSKFINTQ